MKRTNAVVLLIIAVIIIVIGGGLYWAQKTGRISLFAAFEGWPDVTADDPAYEEMMYVGEQGWMTGYEDGLFQPDWDATRAQVVVGEIRARGETVGDITCNQIDPTTWPFTDVDCNHWAFDEISKAKQLGIIDGFPEGNFRPNDSATRAEAVVFVVKAKEWSLDHGETCTPGDASTYPFPDVSCDHWAYDYIVVAKQQSVIFGYDTGEFRPEQDASRRDLAILLYRAFIQPGQEITLSGIVRNSSSSEGIAGANVAMVESVEGTVVSDDTDSTGAYQLRVVAITNSSFSIRASATGYQSSTQGIVLDADKTVNFLLTPVSDSEGVISGIVRNSDNSEAITGATVTVLNYESGSQLADITDSSGAYELRLAATTGTFSVKASASNYQSKTLATTLSGGVATLNFPLDPVVDDPGDPDDPGQPPTIVIGDGRTVSAATTGATLPVVMVLLGSVLALFSLIYLLRTNKPEETPQV